MLKIEALAGSPTDKLSPTDKAFLLFIRWA
jgi:hypothetical protein